MWVSEQVRAKALVLGATRWLDELPALVARLAAEWSFTVQHTYPHSTEAFVAAVTLDDGTPAVLKVVLPRRDLVRHELTVLRLAGGSGCVALLRDDLDRGAMLLERLGPALSELSVPIGRRHEILCAAARRLWRPAPDCGLPTGAQKGERLAEYTATTWEELGRPCSAGTVDHALACAARRVRAHDDDRAVLVHGDVHQWNALRAGDGFRLVDPDGLLAEPEYDLGIIMREDPEEMLTGDPRDRARWLAAHTGLDATAIWEWGVVERVSTGLLGTSVGLQPVARQMLAVADRIARDYA